MKYLWLLCLIMQSMQSMNVPDLEKQPIIEQQRIDALRQILDKNETPTTPEDRQFVITKTKIAAVVTVSLSLISAGVSLGMYLVDCKKD